MVDTTTSGNLVNEDIVAAENRNRITRAAKIWWSNMLAVIKLRQKGKTVVSKLPRGVFRHILEYEFPNELIFRYSRPCVPIENRMQDRHFPAIDKLDYDNYLVSINNNVFEYQFTLLDGANCGSGRSGNNWTSLQIS